MFSTRRNFPPAAEFFFVCERSGRTNRKKTKKNCAARGKFRLVENGLKSGYIVIQDTDSENVKKWIGKECGQVHGAVYRNAFGESVKNAKVVGEGFALPK